MSRLFENNAATTLSAGITAGQTNIPITNGNAFPTASGTNNFYVTLDDTAGTYEILLVTAHTQAPGAATMTATRGQDGTAAAIWPINTLIEMRVVAAEYREFVAETDAGVNLQGNLTVQGAVTFAGKLGVPSGGTGNASFTTGALLVGAGALPLTALEPAGDGTPMHLVTTTNGVNWTSESTATVVTKAVLDYALQSPNMLEVTRGGTGRASFTAGDILVGNGVGGINTIPAGSIPTLATTRFLRTKHEFTTAGTFYLTPANGAYLRITAKSAGGGGGGAFNFDTGPGYGGDGGAGAVASGFFSPLLPSTLLTIVVPAGGTAGLSGGNPPNPAGTGGGTAGGTGPSATVSGTGIAFSVPGGAGGGGGAYRTNGGAGAAGDGTDASVPPNQGLQVPPIITATNSGSLTWGHPATGGGGAGGAGGRPSQDLDTGYVAAAAGGIGYILIEEYY